MATVLFIQQTFVYFTEVFNLFHRIHDILRPLTPNLLNVTSKVPTSVRCGIVLFPTYCSFVSSKFSFCRST